MNRQQSRPIVVSAVTSANNTIHSGGSRRLAAGLLAVALFSAACGSDAETSPIDETRDTSDAATDATTDATTDPATEVSGNSEPSDSDSAAAAVTPASITLVTYDSFPAADTSLNDALATFTDETGIDVDLLVAGDAGTMLAKAALTVGNPEGDVMFGIDNTFLSRAVNDGVFVAPSSPVTADLPPDLVDLAPGGVAVPVDFGDVCVNYDIGWFDAAGIEPPSTLTDLTDPDYADLLVIQNPATSSPGLAFLLATIDEFGDDGWQDYWTSLRSNGVRVVDGWTDAYYGSFTWAGDGDRPLVVSYGSSPPAEVIFAEPARDDAPTGVIDSTCFRQVEFAGVLAGTEHPAEAAQLLDFLVGPTFQSELALNLFVYPANTAIDLPQEFIDFAVAPDASRSIDLDRLDANRADWIDTWTTLVLD